MSWLYRGVSYCSQIAARLSTPSQKPALVSQCPSILKPSSVCAPVQQQSVRWSSSEDSGSRSVAPTYKFKVKSPYKNPGPRRYGYRQEFFDGGPLPRGLQEPVHTLKKYRPVNTWSKQRALFGRNDYIDILGDTDLKPVDLLNAPAWLKGFNGNELQRIVRRMNVEGHRIRQLYPTFYEKQQKRLDFMYKKYNRRRGKRHT